MNKFKAALSYILIVISGVLAAILYRKVKQLDKAESDLAGAVAKGVINANEQERKMARDHADALLAEYERSKRGDS